MPYHDPEKYREYNRLRAANLYAERRGQELCTRCGTAAFPGKMSCADCLIRLAGYARKRRKQYMVRGICIYCSNPPRAGKQTCSDCAVRGNGYSQKLRRKRKEAMLCTRCGMAAAPGKQMCGLLCSSTVRPPAQSLCQSQRRLIIPATSLRRSRMKGGCGLGIDPTPHPSTRPKEGRTHA